MSAYSIDWLNLLFRWSHLLAGIAWIGTSFYFVALDFSLRKNPNLPDGVAGESWQVHGGGFYNIRKYLVAPKLLPADLIWFKWEAYLTWVTGFLLLIAQYYVNATAALIDPNIYDLTPAQAIGISVLSLAAGWLIYDQLCRWFAIPNPKLLIVLVFALVMSAAWGYAHLYSGRGAFIHIGALIGTFMAANVFLVIIPNQRKIAAALLRGDVPDAKFGAMGKQRSLHNTYLTLPVLFMMISNHFSMITDHPFAWVIAGLMMLAGVALRYVLLRHEVGDPWPKLVPAMAIFTVGIGTAYLITGPFYMDWLNLLIRWGHLIAGIAWIGTSIYFIALDFGLSKPATLPKGVSGESWQVHGGGFYHVEKYISAPDTLPEDLVWFKWEAYLTWVTGFLLLILLYYVQANTYLIDPAVWDTRPLAAIGVSLASLLGGWIVYSLLCRSPVGKNSAVLAIFLFALILLAAFGFAQVFSGRGAFIHVGALIGTVMAANVFMVIIPNQKKITAALLNNEIPDPDLGRISKQRSLHNTYLTLPALLLMISHHYPMVIGSGQSWALVGAIVVGGAIARHIMLRAEIGLDREDAVWAIPAIAGALVMMLVLTQPAKVEAYAGEVSDQQALSIIQARCASCHAANPTDKTTKVAPKGIMLETLDQLKRYHAQVEVQAVRNRSMPMGNKTKMTIEERAQLGAWIAKQ